MYSEKRVILTSDGSLSASQRASQGHDVLSPVVRAAHKPQRNQCTLTTLATDKPGGCALADN
jgi:hypothetical protein